MKLSSSVRFDAIALAAGAAVLVSGCTQTRQLTPPLDYQPRRVVEIERYAVHQGDQPLGALVLLEIEDRAGPLRFWRVENNSGAWVGTATEQLRFSRRLPFRDDEQDLGIWPMAQGVARLFDLDGAVDLQQRPVAAPAAARRQQ